MNRQRMGVSRARPHHGYTPVIHSLRPSNGQSRTSCVDVAVTVMWADYGRDRREFGKHVASFAVPAGLGVLTWLVLVVAIGAVAELDSLSVLNVLGLLVIVVMFWPLYLLAPWRPALTERVTDVARGRGTGILVAAALGVLRVLPVTPDVLVGILNLPFRSAGVLFGAKLFYGRRLGAEAGRYVLKFGQWYLEALWLFLIGVALVRFGRWIRRDGSEGTADRAAGAEPDGTAESDGVSDGRAVAAGMLLVLVVASGLAVALAPAGTGQSSVPSSATNDSTEYRVTADGTRYTVHPSQLRQGCPGGTDCIPSIDEPRFQSTDEANWLEANDLVIGVEVDGTARAYPLRILNVHEVVNDRIAGEPVAVTYCPLCRSGLVFSRRVGGSTLTFGVSGKLLDANLVLYDRQTDTYWSQLSGEAVVGPLVPRELEIRPSTITTWEKWKRAHPETAVLSRNTGIYPTDTYGSNPYAGYANSSSVGFGVEAVDDRLPPKDLVYGVTVGNASRAYPATTVSELGVINDEVGEVPVAVVEDPGDGAVRTFISELENESLRFSVADGELVDQHGDRWSFEGEALEGAREGSHLDEIPTHGVYWFAWSSFHPETGIYGHDDTPG